MSKVKYSLKVKGQGANDVVADHDLDYLVPIVRGDYDNDWDDHSKRQDLMQAIEGQKSLNFQKRSESSSDEFWERRHKLKTVIPLVTITAAYEGGRRYRYLLYDVETILPAPFVQGHPEYRYQSVSLRFENSQVQEPSF